MKRSKKPVIVDGGFSAAKAKMGADECRIAAVYAENPISGELFNGKKYIVGDEALMASGNQYLLDVDDLIQFYPLFVHACARKIGVNSAPMLAVGLPYEYWKLEAIKSMDGASNIIAVLSNKLASFQVAGIDYEFDSVRIYPQGLGAIKTFLNMRSETKGCLLSVDIGFNTIISTIYSVDTGRVVASDTFYQKGISYLVNGYLKPMISQYIKDRSFSPPEMNKILETRLLPIDGFSHRDIEFEVEAASADFARKTIGDTMKTMKQRQGGLAFSAIVFSGGGARLLQNISLKYQGVEVFIIPNPEMGNAIGFDIMARRELGLDLEPMPNFMLKVESAA